MCWQRGVEEVGGGGTGFQSNKLIPGPKLFHPFACSNKLPANAFAGCFRRTADFAGVGLMKPSDQVNFAAAGISGQAYQLPHVFSVAQSFPSEYLALFGR